MDRWSFLRIAQPSMAGRAMACSMLQWVLAGLRAQYWNYQESHWRTRGENFYGNHLLFQRLYESVQEQVDGLAEKMVAMFGEGSVSTTNLSPKFEQWLAQWNEIDCLHAKGLASEEGIQEAIRRAYDRLKELDVLTLGMDDFLMATASEHETNEYLLKQALQSKKMAGDWAALRGDT